MTRALLAALALTIATPSIAAKPADRTKVANFSLKNLKKKKVELSNFLGSVVVVNFWATWCEPCKQELPFLNKYYLEHKDEGLVVLAITTDGPRTLPAVRQTVRRKKWQMPILLDLDGAVAGDLNPRGAAPYTMYLDRQGRLAGDHDGYAPGDEVKMYAKIKELLAEGQPAKVPAAPAPAP